MSAAPAALLLAALVASACALRPFYTVEQKGFNSQDTNDKRLFYVPAGQCSGVLGKELKCHNGLLPLLVRVVLVDALPYAQVSVSNQLDGVSILRVQNAEGQCPTRANVDVYLYCVRYQSPSNRRMLSERSAVPASN